MKFDDLDAKMRVFETAHDHRVLPGMFIVARLDGRGFTKLTKQKRPFEAPFDATFRDYMVSTTEHLMDCGFRVIYGYTQSDEISLLFHPDEQSFDRKVRKYNSILAGEASATFSLLLGDVACFDCRISQLPNTDLVYDLLGSPRDNTIRVRFLGMQSVKTDGGTAYYSPHRPTIDVGGERKIVAFTSHAGHRICERTVRDWSMWEGMCDAFACLNYCVYFEPCRLSGDQAAFTLYQKCTEGFFSKVIALGVLGTLDDDKQYYYRIGYCPAVVNGDFVIAKTLLTPGMRGTPEYERVLKPLAKSEGHRKELQKRVQQLTFRGLCESQDFDLLQQFHEGGVPQVVTFDHEVFRYPK